MDFQNAYSKSVRTSDLECKDKSLTQQSFTEETDINVLLERFRVTGQMPTAVRLPSYGDFSAVSDYRTAMDAVLRAEDSFNELPAQVRQRFGNDPQAFLEFCSKDENRPELARMGLLNIAEQDVGVSGAEAPDVS